MFPQNQPYHCSYRFMPFVPRISFFIWGRQPFALVAFIDSYTLYLRTPYTHLCLCCIFLHFILSFHSSIGIFLYASLSSRLICVTIPQFIAIFIFLPLHFISFSTQMNRLANSIFFHILTPYCLSLSANCWWVCSAMYQSNWNHPKPMLFFLFWILFMPFS